MVSVWIGWPFFCPGPIRWKWNVNKPGPYHAQRFGPPRLPEHHPTRQCAHKIVPAKLTRPHPPKQGGAIYENKRGKKLSVLLPPTMAEGLSPPPFHYRARFSPHALPPRISGPCPAKAPVPGEGYPGTLLLVYAQAPLPAICPYPPKQQTYNPRRAGTAGHRVICHETTPRAEARGVLLRYS